MGGRRSAAFVQAGTVPRPEAATHRCPGGAAGSDVIDRTPLLAVLRAVRSFLPRDLQTHPAPPDQPELPTGLAATQRQDNVKESDVIEIRPPALQFFLHPDPGRAHFRRNWRSANALHVALAP